MLLWMNLFTLVKSASQFFRVCFEIWQFGYWRYKDMHTCNAEILPIQRHAQLQCWDIGNSKTFIVHWPLPARGALSDRWLKGAWVAARYVFSSTVCMVWSGMGDLAGRYIRRTLVLGGHTIRMGGRRYIQHSLIWQCKLLLWICIEFSPWNN